MQSQLVDQLIALLRLKGSAITKGEFVAQLPSAFNCTERLALRACDQLGVKASVLTISADNIEKQHLPAIARFKSGEYAILRERNGQRWMVSNDNHEALTLSHDQLREQFSGSLFFVQPPNATVEGSLNKILPNRSHWFWSIVRSSSGLYKPAILNSLFINIFALASPLFVMNVYDRVVPNGAIDTLTALAFGAVMVMVFDFILKRYRQRLVDTAARRADILLSSRLYNKALRLDKSARPSSVGVFANNLRDFDSLRSFISSTTIVALADLPFVVIFLLVIGLIGGPLVAIPLLLIPIVLGYSWYAQNKALPATDASHKISAQKNAHAVESIASADTIKHLGLEGERLAQYETQSSEHAHLNYQTKTINSSISHVAVFAQQLASIAIICWGVFLISGLELTMGALIACVMISSRIGGPISQVANLVAQYSQTKKAFDALDSLMSLSDDATPQSGSTTRVKTTGDIELAGVNVAVSEQKQAIIDASLSIKAGDHIAVLGRVGAGKSSLIELLATLRKPSQGDISYSGVNRSHQDLSDLRDAIAVVDQNPAFFTGTLRNNLDPSQLASDEQLLALTSELGLDNFIADHPDGLDQPISEFGKSLSGGQRQCLALIRAILRKPQILLLDEPTSGLDRVTEAMMIRFMQNHAKSMTLVVATHKSSMLELATRVIVLEQGRIAFNDSREAFAKVSEVRK